MLFEIGEEKVEGN